jgi:hypothetical protein
MCARVVFALCVGAGGVAGGEHLGRLYGVLYKRRGKILSEDLMEGTQTFRIIANLPVCGMTAVDCCFCCLAALRLSLLSCC